MASKTAALVFMLQRYAFAFTASSLIFLPARRDLPGS
jgi:hypothetical protein